MACNCHGKNGIAVIKASSYDQCTTCAKKHVVKAWSLWNEFTYIDDNRDTVSGQQRLAADHLMYDHTETALKCRDLAVIIEENKDLEQGSVANKLKELLDEVRDLFYTEHPDAKERLEKIKQESETHISN